MPDVRVGLDITEEKYNMLKKYIDDKTRVCYGALSSFQVQLHHLCGTIEETQGLTEEALVDIRGINEDFKKIKKFLIERIEDGRI